jgi:hypothetical protein
MSGSILIIILSRYIDRENYCHVTNKQTNALAIYNNIYTFQTKKNK